MTSFVAPVTADIALFIISALKRWSLTAWFGAQSARPSRPQYSDYSLALKIRPPLFE